MDVEASLRTYWVKWIFLAGFPILLIFLVMGEALANFSEQREAAKSLVNSGNDNDVISGMKQLKKLSDTGDAVSSHTLGVIYLRSKLKSVNRNINLAEKYFLIAAQSCHQPSLKVLNDFFYARRGSNFFAPNKIKVLKAACETKQNLPTTVTSQEANQENKPNASNSQTPDNWESPKALTPAVRASWERVWPNDELVQKIVHSGSGFAFSSTGLFLTNDHVVEGCSSYAIGYNGLFGKAKLLLKNSNLDVAVLKVDAPTPFFAVFDNSSLKLGEGLIAIGYPVGSIFGSEPSVSEGRLTNTSDQATIVRKEGFLLVSVPMASGNSGGPILGEGGLLRGVVSYGFDSNELMDDLQKDKGIAPALGTVTLNFMVSGLRLIEWLDKHKYTISQSNGATRKLDAISRSKLGTQMLAQVFCG